jgi:DeoR family transcriptional regulator, glycerol-3-phosphate regulon repressor
MPVISIDAPPTETDLSERQSRILEIVQGRGFATIEQLSEVFAVSAQTIRREVIRLDAAGLLQRFHGGAGIAGDSVRLGYRHKQEAAIGSKARVGRAVAGLVPDGASIYLDVGTTVEAVAAALVGRPLGMVWTNSMSAAAILGQSREAEIYVTGGIVRGGDGSLVGDAATKALAPIAVDFAIIGCSGFATDGSPSDFDPQKVAIKQAAIDNARTTIIAVDSSKFDRMAVMQIAPLASFQMLVSDREPHETLGRQLRAVRIEVQIAA